MISCIMFYLGLAGTMLIDIITTLHYYNKYCTASYDKRLNRRRVYIDLSNFRLSTNK